MLILVCPHMMKSPGIIKDEVDEKKKRYQKPLRPEFSKSLVRRLVRQVADNLDLRAYEFEPESILTIQSAMENFTVVLFRSADGQRHTQSMCNGHMVSYPCSVHNSNKKLPPNKPKRMTLNVNDIKAALVEGFCPKTTEEGVFVWQCWGAVRTRSLDDRR